MTCWCRTNHADGTKVEDLTLAGLHSRLPWNVDSIVAVVVNVEIVLPERSTCVDAVWWTGQMISTRQVPLLLSPSYLHTRLASRVLVCHLVCNT